jgi:hypothetical protein
VLIHNNRLTDIRDMLRAEIRALETQRLVQ